MRRLVSIIIKFLIKEREHHLQMGNTKTLIWAHPRPLLGGGVRNKPLAAYHKKLPLIPNSQKNDVLAQWGAIYAPHASLEKCQLSEFSSI